MLIQTIKSSNVSRQRNKMALSMPKGMLTFSKTFYVINRKSNFPLRMMEETKKGHFSWNECPRWPLLHTVDTVYIKFTRNYRIKMV